MGGQEAYEAAGELLRALAAPIRVAIVTELADGQRCVHELVDALGVAQPLVSQHLRVLRGAGVVRGARRGREIAYSLVDEHIAHIVADAVSHATEPRSTEPRSTEPRSTEPRSAEPRSAEPRSTEPRTAEPRTTGTAPASSARTSAAANSTPASTAGSTPASSAANSTPGSTAANSTPAGSTAASTAAREVTAP